MIPDVDRNALWQAIRRFDNEYRNSSEWAGWEQNGNHLYAIKLGGKLYPVKFVVSLATGVPTSAFSGGKASGQANEYVREREFAVVEISEELTQHSTPAAPSPSSRYWIEKTHVRGRPDRESGEHALGQALWSPQKSADGRDYYRNMREVKPGDVVFHLIDNECICGASLVETRAEDNLVGLPNTEWAGRDAYRIGLRDYVELSPTLHRNNFMRDSAFAEELHRVYAKRDGHGLFYTKDLELNQGAYLTEAPPELVDVLNRAYRQAAGKQLPYVDDAWIANQSAPQEDAQGDGKNDMKPKEQVGDLVPPTNLILYGPPGTGKTYTTIDEAVLFCDGALPEGGRPALKARYDELVKLKRIEFVTFHQSYSYEEFVMGLRPQTGEAEGQGFTLEPIPGVFYRIAETARTSRGTVGGEAASDFNQSRRAFKMSLGAIATEEGTTLFRECIEGGYVLLGWGGDVDWSGPEYSNLQTIEERWRKEDPNASSQDSNIKQLHQLRNLLKVGDLVIVSSGNSKFRAIGEVTGSYQYAPRDDGEFFHRRPVRWMWHDSIGLPREQIYAKQFSQRSIYQLDSADVDWPALKQIAVGGGEAGKGTGVPESYVLIIDEINRADISKVLGELITLLEPDKRLGMENALTVRLPYSNERFGVPANLHVIGTMNSADRSIALLDTALRRRFRFRELMPDPNLLTPVEGIDIAAALKGLNGRIEYLFDRDHQVGHAYFMGCTTRAELESVMRDKVIPLLVEYFYENWTKVWQVLAEPETGDKGAFLRREKLNAPKGGEDSDFEDVRWRYSVREDFAENAFAQLAA